MPTRCRDAGNCSFSSPRPYVPRCRGSSRLVAPRPFPLAHAASDLDKPTASHARSDLKEIRAMFTRFLLFLALIALIVLAALSVFTVDQTEFVYVTQFGRHVATYDGATQGGLYLRWPWPIQSLQRLDRR